MSTLTEFWTFLGIVALSVGAGLFCSGLGLLGAAAAMAAIPLTVVLLCAIIGGLVLGFDARSKRMIAKIDPDWEAKAKTLNKRLRDATYRWQLTEFGTATKAFRVDLGVRDKPILGEFYPNNDTDIVDLADKDVSDAEFDEIYMNRSNEIEALHPSKEALERLHTSLQRIYDTTLDPKLTKALWARREVRIDTGQFFLLTSHAKPKSSKCSRKTVVGA
jgi:hypothetical protein